MSVVERPDDYTVIEPLQPYHSVRPFAYLESRDIQPQSAFVILNQRIDDAIFESIWTRLPLRICADGGANRLFHHFQSDILRKRYVPQIIVGDLDSVTHDVLEYYRGHGTVIVTQVSQYSLDFTKAVLAAQLYMYSDESRQKLLDCDYDEVNGLAELAQMYTFDKDALIYFTGALGGRLDQSIQLLNQLYLLAEQFPSLDAFFVTKHDVVFLLRKGKNYITYTSRSLFSKSKTPSCGLLPLGGQQVVLSTCGLRYDVDHWPTRMGGDVSSSNALVGIDGIIVEASSPIVMNISSIE